MVGSYSYFVGAAAVACKKVRSSGAGGSVAGSYQTNCFGTGSIDGQQPHTIRDLQQCGYQIYLIIKHLLPFILSLLLVCAYLLPVCTMQMDSVVADSRIKSPKYKIESDLRRSSCAPQLADAIESLRIGHPGKREKHTCVVSQCSTSIRRIALYNCT